MADDLRRCPWHCLNRHPALAQQPFKTDDADVTGRGKWELQIISEFDILQRSLFPNLRQNTADFTLNYGVTERVEIGVESPLIAQLDATGTSPRSAFVVGDTSIQIKYNLRKEQEESGLHAMAVSFNVVFPTGDVTTGGGGARNKGSASMCGCSIVRQIIKSLDIGLEVTGVRTGDPPSTVSCRCN